MFKILTPGLQRLDVDVLDFEHDAVAIPRVGVVDRVAGVELDQLATADGSGPALQEASIGPGARGHLVADVGDSRSVHRHDGMLRGRRIELHEAQLRVAAPQRARAGLDPGSARELVERGVVDPLAARHLLQGDRARVELRRCGQVAHADADPADPRQGLLLGRAPHAVLLSKGRLPLAYTPAAVVGADGLVRGRESCECRLARSVTARNRT
jgi:hypothetical protein